MRPVVGITSYAEQARWGVWNTAAVLLPRGYVTHVADAGAIPVMLPPVGADPQILDRLDALILAGGADIDPALYAAPLDPHTTDLRPDRDAAELALLAAALDRDLPVLGICRGAQLMAVAATGRLHQHLPDALGHTGHRPSPGQYGHHPVRLAADSLAARILGERAEVNSYHHQGIADPGRYRATGWSVDESIEVIEDPQRHFALGVQWHPEAEADPRLFAALVAACRVPARG